MKTITEAAVCVPELLPVLERAKTALSRQLQQLQQSLSPAPVEVPKKRKKRVLRFLVNRGVTAPKKVVDIQAPSKTELAPLMVASWDPEPVIGDLAMDSSCCRALLLEIIRRAASDWVLYRNSSRIQDRKLAEDAHFWLFEETKESPSWEERTADGKCMTAFLTICDTLDFDPDSVRTYIRKLTIKNVMSVGRPAERRRQQTEEMIGEEHSVYDLNLDELPSYDPTFGTGG